MKRTSRATPALFCFWLPLPLPLPTLRNQTLRRSIRLAQPLHVQIRLLPTQVGKPPAEPSHTPSDLVLLFIHADEAGRVPERVVRSIAREADDGARRCRPVDDRRAVDADEALGEDRDHGIRERLRPPLPDVRAAVWRG